ncbi:oligosaccharide repeat unit polymerase [Deinococcus ruber]|uniref:oligosaccharide repeat unit polymerase n=1 Tax=Deinococcus ruber TaxID=1848197 RepID=UPI001667C6E3|nr:oligosaccharide repeat unit polymerase [Deinococcus ruber]
MNFIGCYFLDDTYEYILTGAAALITIIILFTKTPFNIRPLQAWCIGFIVIVLSEALYNRTKIIYVAGLSAYESASLFICLSFSFICFVTSFLNLFDVNDSIRNADEDLRPTNITYVMLSIMYGIYFIYAIPLAFTTFKYGRLDTLAVETSHSTLEAIVAGLGGLASSILPAATIYVLFAKKEYINQPLKFNYILRAMLFVSPLIITQFFLGVRSVIVTTVLSMVFMVLKIFSVRISNVPQFIALAGVLLFITNFMKNSRVGGEAAIVSGTVQGIDISSFSEGVVQSFSQMHNYFPLAGFEQGKEHLTLLLFWIPKTLWPEKPPQLENWFPQVIDPGFFSSFHSTAATFGATAYADFGFSWGLIVCGLQGILLGLLEARTNSYLKISKIAQISPNIIIYASAMGTVFYSIRQFNSVFITTISILFAYLLIRSTFKKPHVVKTTVTDARSVKEIMRFTSQK